MRLLDLGVINLRLSEDLLLHASAKDERNVGWVDSSAIVGPALEVEVDSRRGRRGRLSALKT